MVVVANAGLIAGIGAALVLLVGGFYSRKWYVRRKLEKRKEKISKIARCGCEL